MARYQSKPKVITAMEFQPDRLEHIPAHIYRDKDNNWVVWNGLHKSAIQIEPGDFVRVDDPNDTYSIDAEYMAVNYDELTEGDNNG